MSEDTPEPDPFPWFPLEKALSWLKITDPTDPRAVQVDDCRKAACEYIEDQRPDLQPGDDAEEDVTFPTAKAWRMKDAARLATARLWERRDSPNGIISFQDLGAASLLRNDPDVRRQIGRARPVTG